MEHTSTIFAQRLTGPLAFLDVIYWHVHRMLKSQAHKELVHPALQAFYLQKCFQRALPGGSLHRKSPFFENITMPFFASGETV